MVQKGKVSQGEELWLRYRTRKWIAKDIHELLALLKEITTCKDYPITVRAFALSQAHLLNQLVCDGYPTKHVFRKERLPERKV